jgi:hypothetical protein
MAQKTTKTDLWVVGLIVLGFMGVGAILFYRGLVWAHGYFDLAPVTMNPRAHQEQFYFFFLVLPCVIFLITLLVLTCQALWKRVKRTWSTMDGSTTNSWRLLRDLGLFLLLATAVLAVVVWLIL